MSDYLYVAVDESGSVATHDKFEVAACWYLSDKGPRAALNETKSSLRDQLEDTGHLPEGKDEIKGKDLNPAGLDFLFDSLCRTAFDDATVENSRLPLDRASPVAYSFAGTSTSLARAAMDALDPHTSVEESIRTMLLLSVLNPLLYHDRFQTVKRDETRVLLDASVWSESRDRLKESNEVSTRSLEFLIRDSEKTPGIQLADVAANARFKRYSDKSFDGTHDTLEELRL